MMNRRNFLKGTLVGVTAATALVQLASPGEVEALQALATADPHLMLGRPDIEGVPSSMMETPEVFMYVGGKLVCVGTLVDLKVTHSQMDVTPLGAENRQFMPGMRRLVGTFRG